MSDIETPINEEDVALADEILEVTILEEEFEEPVAESAFDRPGRWYIVHTFAGHEQKVIGALHNTDFVMRNVLWLGVFPGLTRPMLDHIAGTISRFTAKGATLPVFS